MKEIIVPIHKFDFKGFAAKSIEFAEQYIDPDYAVAWVDEPGDIPEYVNDYENKDALLELLIEGKVLFIMFSDSNIGDSIACADSNEYVIDEDSDFCLGDTDCVGYLLQSKDSVLTINSAINASGACTAPPPSVDIENDCDVFDKPLEDYIKKYIDK